MFGSLNTIDATFESAVEDLRGTRLVACVEAYPVCPARMGSAAIKKYFEEHPHEFVTNDGRAVYYSQDNIIKVHDDLGVSISGYDVKDYLTREFAHLFMQHSRLRRYYNKDEIKANTFLVACEIEACRTKGLSPQRTCYQTSATDSLFTCTKEAKYLRQIYQALVDEYGDEIEQFAEQQKGDNQNGGQQGEGSGEQNSDQQSDGNQSGDQQRGDGDGSGDNSGDGQQSSTPSGTGSGHQEQSQKDSGQHQRDGELPVSGGGKLTDEQKEQLAKTFARAEDKLSPVDGDDQMLQDYGIEPGEGSEEAELADLIDTTYERWRDKQLKKQLAKLKSAIEGQVSKRKYSTYARPSRRACTSNGLLTKGRKKELVGQPTILVALDGSGSMSAQRIRDLTHCIGNIFDDLGRPKRGCYICMFDDEIVMSKPMREWRTVCERYRASGGTNYNCVLKHANKLGVDVVIEVGDGEGDLTWAYTKNNALAEFKANNRKWIDLLVQHREQELQAALHHAANDAYHAGVERTLLCLDEDMSIVLEDIERRKQNY